MFEKHFDCAQCDSLTSLKAKIKKKHQNLIFDASLYMRSY